ncbi:hypothetical protein BS78_02G241500 [Paspalum vaginatum]|nr:hypothetical protein BS78_02G241500 [Paspalum vaginatum]
MDSPRSWSVRIVVAYLVLAAVVAAASMGCAVGAAPRDGACLPPPAVKAREAAVAMLMARLPAGSSPRGAGH